MGRTTRRRKPGMADALFTTTQQRVLGVLFGHPERTFIQQELIDSTRSGSGAVQRELGRLVDCGLVAVTILGRRKHYQANRDAAIFEELRSIVAKVIAAKVAVRERVQVRVEAPARRKEPPPETEWQLIFD